MSLRLARKRRPDSRSHASRHRLASERLEDRVLLAVASAGDEFRVNTTLPGPQQAPSIARDIHGNYTVVWTSSSLEIRGQRFSKEGVPLGGEFRIDDGSGFGVEHADIAMEPDGDFVVAWSGNVRPGPGPDTYDVVWARRFRRDGAAGDQVVVDGPTFHGGGDVHIAADGDGDYVIVWHHQSGFLEEQEIRVRRYRGEDAGQLTPKTEAATVVFNDGVIIASHPDVASDMAGNFVVTWQQAVISPTVFTNDVMAHVYHSSGATIRGAFVVNDTPGGASAPAVAMRGDGVFMVVWEEFHGSDSEIRAQGFNADGSARLEFDIPVNEIFGGNQSAPDIGASRDGRFLIAWNGPAAPGRPIAQTLHAREFDADGIPGTNEFDLNENSAVSGSGQFPAVAGGHCCDYAVVWQNSQNVTDIWNRVYVSDVTSSGGTLDTDGDGLPDCWELFGYEVEIGGQTIFVDLPAMGANPLRKDIFVEIDYMVERDANGVVTRTHKPDGGSMNAVLGAFENAPVANPDGSTGITLHIDAGPDSFMMPASNNSYFGDRPIEWGDLAHGGEVPWQDELGAIQDDQYDWTEFDAVKFGPDGQSGTADDRFAVARRYAFHYAISAHTLGNAPLTVGMSRGGLDDEGAGDFLLSLGDPSNNYLNEAITFMHELGHNLGLGHGGLSHENYKPNYFSVMNYLFSWNGLYLGTPGGIYDYYGIDYSRWELDPLNESNLDESAGVGGGGFPHDEFGTVFYRNGQLVAEKGTATVNWNGLPGLQAGVSLNLNSDNPTDALTELASFNDWANLVFTGGAIGDFNALPPPMTTEAEGVPVFDSPGREIGVSVGAVAGLGLDPGANDEIFFTVTNTGLLEDTFDLLLTTLREWADPLSIPTSITIPPGESRQVVVEVAIPLGTGGGVFDEIQLFATSQTIDRIADAAVVEVRALGDPDAPPTVELIVPVNGSAVLAGTPFVVRAFAEDDIGILRVDFLADNVVVGSATGPFEVSVTLPPGLEQATLTAIAFDTAGQTATSEPIVVDVVTPVSYATIRASGRVLRIQGDAGVNNILVDRTPLGALRITGRDGTLVNGSTDPLILPQRIDRIMATLGAGDDTLELIALELSQLKINTQGGDDAVLLDEVRVRNQANVLTGDGDDHVTIDSLDLRKLHVSLGAGDDVLELIGASVPQGRVDGGVGNDSLLASWAGVSPLPRRVERLQLWRFEHGGD